MTMPFNDEGAVFNPHVTTGRSTDKARDFGGGLARAALSLVERAGRELHDTGTLGFLDGAISYDEVQRRIGS